MAERVLVAMSGANYIHDAAGLMEMDLTVSYEKLVMDKEILGMCQRVLRGIEVSDDTLGLPLMIEVGPGGNFMTEDHTLEYMFSEFFVPDLANREKRERMAPHAAAWDRARARVDEVRRHLPQSCLSPALRTELLQHFPEICVPFAAAPPGD